MRRVNSVGDLSQQTNSALDGQSSLAAKKAVKSLALDVFHHEIKRSFRRLTKIGDAYGVRMLNGCRGLSFPFKSRDRLALLQVVAAQNVGPNGFYGNTASREFFIGGKINLSHGATAQPAFKQIALSKKLGPLERDLGRRLVVWTDAHVIAETKLAFWTFTHLKQTDGPRKGRKLIERLITALLRFESLFRNCYNPSLFLGR